MSNKEMAVQEGVEEEVNKGKIKEEVDRSKIRM